MATAGFYLHRRGIIAASEKKALARISQQVTIPCLFFTKIINCPQNFSYKKCPNFSDNLADVWWLLFWPLFVVGCGLLVGEVAVFLSHTPKQQRPSVLAAVAFANSTGLPITLLTVIHANFPPTSEIGRVDPNLFLSVYLILYPVLQWGVGWWLLSPEETGYRESELLTLSTIESDGSTELDGVASDMIRELSLSDLMTEKTHRRTTIEAEEDKELIPKKTVDTNSATYGHDVHENAIPPLTMTGTLARALPKALQPPVIAALAGLFITAFVPLRGLFVDLHDRDDDAPLEWLFDGLMLVRTLACLLDCRCCIVQLKQDGIVSVSRTTSLMLLSYTADWSSCDTHQHEHTGNQSFSDVTEKTVQA